MNHRQLRPGLCAKCHYKKAQEKSWPLCPRCWRRYRCPRCNVLNIDERSRALCAACVHETGSTAMPNRRWRGRPCPRQELPYREAYYASRAAARLPLFEGAPWLEIKPNVNYVCAYCKAPYELTDSGEKHCCPDCCEEAYTDQELRKRFTFKIGSGSESWDSVGRRKVTLSDESGYGG